MRPDLEEQMERMLRSFRQTREQLMQAQTRTREAQGWATSRDNLITCAVTSAGISDLTISPRALQRYDAPRLAATIREVIAEANAHLQAYAAEQYREVLGDSFDPQALTDPDAATEAIQNMRRRLQA